MYRTGAVETVLSELSRPEYGSATDILYLAGQAPVGEFIKVSDSYAYLYIYELLNNIGVDSPIAGFQGLMAFRNRYVDQFSSRMGAIWAGGCRITCSITTRTTS